MKRTYTQLHLRDKYSEHSSIIWSVWPNGWMVVNELNGSGFESSSHNAHSSSKDFLDIQATIECGFTLRRVRGMIRRYSQLHHTDKYSEHGSNIWSVWPNGWVFVYKLSGCGFESRWSYLTFTSRACFEPGFTWHSSNYRVCIHSETRTSHDKNIQSIAPYI